MVMNDESNLGGAGEERQIGQIKQSKLRSIRLCDSSMDQAYQMIQKNMFVL